MSRQRVRKAVVPVAGLGTRLLPVTKSVPKELLPIVDVPAIQVIVEECVQSGIEEVIFVTGKGKGAIVDHFDFSYELEAILEERGKTYELDAVRKASNMIRTVSVRQKKPLGLGHAILQAKPVVGDEPFLVVLPDDIIAAEVPCSKQLIDVYEKFGEGVVSVLEVEPDQVSNYGIIDGEEWSDGLVRVRVMVEKPTLEQAPSNLAIIGRYILPPIVFTYLEETQNGAEGEIQLTDALQRLARERALVGYKFEGQRHDTGDRFGYIAANITFALERPELRAKLSEFIKGLEL